MSVSIQDIFASLPGRFKNEKAGDYQAIFHFKLNNGNENYFYTVEIFNGACSVKEGLSGQPKCTIESSAQTYLDSELGLVNAQQAVLSGEIRIDNLMEMLNFSKLFRKFQVPQEVQQINFTQIQNRKPQSGPLQGLKVLDLTRLLPGPLATMLMAGMGAEVIKIEAPNFYDYARDTPFRIGEESAFYLAYNHSKKSLALDYSSPEGKEVMYKLVKQADLLMEQFRPGVMAKMGLDYETLKKINPRLIYVSITGYGQTGPYAHLAGHDLNYITLAGVLSGNQFEAPQNPLVQMADIAGGSYMAVIGALSAIYARQQSGKGQFVDIAMMDGVMPLAINAQAFYWATQSLKPREEQFLSGGSVNYGIYPCKDGRYIALGTLEAKFWEKFCDLTGKPEWKGRMLTKDREELIKYKNELSELFMSQTLEYWVDFGLKNDLLINAVNELNEVETDPQVQAREMILEMDHPKAGKIKMMGNPVKFSDTPSKHSWTAPLLGEDSFAVLIEAGLTEENISELIRKGFLKAI